MSESQLAPVSAELQSALAAIVGEKGCVFDPVETAPYCEDWRQLYKGRTLAVVRPANAAEVAAVVRLCAEAGASRSCRRAAIPAWWSAPCPAPTAANSCSALARLNRIRESTRWT